MFLQRAGIGDIEWKHPFAKAFPATMVAPAMTRDPTEGGAQLQRGDVRRLQALRPLGHFEFNRLPFVQRLVSL